MRAASALQLPLMSGMVMVGGAWVARAWAWATRRRRAAGGVGGAFSRLQRYATSTVFGGERTTVLSSAFVACFNVATKRHDLGPNCVSQPGLGVRRMTPRPPRPELACHQYGDYQITAPGGDPYKNVSQS